MAHDIIDNRDLKLIDELAARFPASDKAKFNVSISIACGGRGSLCPGRRTFSETQPLSTFYFVLGAIHECAGFG